MFLPTFRWNSTVDMLERFLVLLPCLRGMALADEFEGYEVLFPSSSVIARLRQYVTVLRPLKSFTVHVSGENMEFGMLSMAPAAIFKLISDLSMSPEGTNFAFFVLTAV
jgi:hypothetical protein